MSLNTHQINVENGIGLLDIFLPQVAKIKNVCGAREQVSR